MPVCKECESHFLRYYLEVAGSSEELKMELPSLYHNTPTCPVCGLIGEVKRSKLRDALHLLRERCEDPSIVPSFMAFYRKRAKDFRDGMSIVNAFLERQP